MKYIARTAFLAAAVAAISPIASFAVEPAALTLALQGDNIVVTVPANALYDTSRLYLVWDAIDNGADLSAWPVAKRIQYAGTLSSAGGTITFDGSGIPVGSIVRALATSDVRLIGGWVKLAGNQYIDTGIVDSSAFGVDFKFRPTGANTGSMYGSVIGSGVDQFTIGMFNSYVNYYLRYGGNGASTQGDAYNPAFVLTDQTIPHVIRIFGGISYLDGVVQNNTLANGTQAKKCGGAVAASGHTILIGTTWNRGSGTTSLSGRYCHGEWHYAKVLDASGNPLVNLVPALRGDTESPIACFYDTVSCTWFDKSGTGGALAYDTEATPTNTVACLAAVSASFSTGVTAYWTGLGDLAKVNDPANWACTNAAGVEVVGAYPDIRTIVKVPDISNFNVPAGQALSFNEIYIGASGTLATNCDWSGLASSTQCVAYVNETAGLSEVEYLDAPNGSYIDTGFQPNERTSVVADFTVVDSTKHEYFFGAWNTDYKTEAFAVGNDVKNLYSGFGNSGGGNGKPIVNGRHVIEFTNGVVRVDGTLHTNRSGQSPFQVNHNLYIFAQNRSGSKYQYGDQPTMRLHSFKIYDGGVLVRDYVPVQRNGSEYVLFDRVARTCATNSGTDTFSGGAATGKPLDRECVSVPFNSSIELAGHKLTLADVSGIGSVTDTTGGGELHVNVESGKTMENTATTFAGQLKLVKDGAGTFIASVKSQSYTGGTLITNGVLKVGVSGGYGNTSLGVEGSEVVVKGADAVFDTNGQNGWTKYDFVLDGGTFRTSVADCADGSALLRYLRLEDDSTFDLQKNFGFVGDGFTATTLDLGGHTLTLNYANSKTFYAENLTISNGTVNLVNGGWFIVKRGELVATNVDFTVQAAFNLSTPVSVRDYTTLYTWSGANTGDVDFNVYGTFTPGTDYFYGCTMRGGSRIDLSGKSGAWSSTAAFTTAGRKTVRYAEGANVTIYVGERRPAEREKIIEWSELPDSSVTFTLAYDDGVDRGLALSATSDGLYVRSAATPAYATWDLEAETPGWKFHDGSGNVIPDWDGGVTSDMQVRFATYAEYVAIAAQGVTPSVFMLTGDMTLPAGEGKVDMSGGFLFDFAAGTTIDLNGRTAVLPDAVMYGTTPFTVSSDVEGGRLEVNVANGATVTNTAMTLAGSLVLVKNGEGTFVAAKTGQTYTGGTFVNGGLLKSTVPTTSCGPAESLITVAAGAGYDWAGTISTTSTIYSFDIAGTGPGGAGALLFSTLSGGYTSYCLKNLTLSDDALVVDVSASSRNDYCGFIQGYPHVLTMNGHTLTIDTGAKFNFVGVTAPDEGTIVFMTTQTGTGSNRMASFWGQDNIMSNVTLDVAENIAVNADTAGKNHVVGTFINRSSVSGAGNRSLCALDCFQPTTTNLQKSVALGDATHLSPILDLSALNGPFVLPTTQTLTAADGATVYVKLGGRRVKNSTPIISWTTKPANIDSIKFEAVSEEDFGIVMKEDGVYIRRGFVITFR